MYVESYQWQIELERILILPLAPCEFHTPYLSLPPLGIATMIPCTWGLSGSDEASATAQPTTGGRSRRHDQRCFVRLEQEDQRLKKHDGRWMDIVRSLQLESFILTKLTKPLVRQLSRPTGQLPKRCAPDVKGRNHFLGR